ncbi:MAG: DUF89 family protein, partial [Nitrospiraceae bacterium]|nr:DUF89 family protein [Nitrospiraceae bacterium]
MKAKLDCIPCMFNQSFRAARNATKDEVLIRKVLDAAGEKIRDIDLNLTPPEAAVPIYNIVEKITGNANPYKKIKKEHINKALSLYPKMKKAVNFSSQPLMQAVKIAIAGNAIDLGSTLEKINIETEFNRIEGDSFVLKDFAIFEKRIAETDEILYLADNAGCKIVGEGDVKYHKGYSTDRCFPSGCVHVSLASNPSHLEAVNPVVEGKCRARQDRLEGDGEQLVMPLLIHGDAAFAGQGVVAETLNLSQLAGYKTGGTIHLVVNNQIGFTTMPVDARSTCYSTDIAKMLMAPIFHVHGDDPEALIQAATMAIEFRQKYRKDVVIEVICYRRYGHNEGDEPFFTQPLMYEKIRNHPLTADIYKTQLLLEDFSEQEIQSIADKIDQNLDEALSHEVCPLHEDFMKQWSHVSRTFSFDPVETGVDKQTLLQLIDSLTTTPDDFTPHRKITTLLKKRHKAIAEDGKIDWGTGESLAMASLVNEGTSIRLSGQDSRRGTFNHRHATLYDIATGQEYTPLADIARQADCRFDVFNSMLSEMAVLGFDYGYAVETPDDLTIWEAQFGDFANGAQVIIDQFIASSLAKWDRPCGITMFLPHGYEG